jgi:hypothetical protein
MREYRFDVVRVVCMTYLVAYFHLYGYVYAGNHITAVYSASTSVAHACLGLFTFVSGYLLGKKYGFGKQGNADVLLFYRKRILRIVPLFVVSSVLLWLIGFNSAVATWNGLICISPFVNPKPLTMYYIPVILWCYLVTPFVSRLGQKWRVYSSISLFSLLLIARLMFPSIDNRFVFDVFFYFVGVVSAPYFDWKFNFPYGAVIKSSILFMFILLIAFFFKYDSLIYYSFCQMALGAAGVFVILFICEGVGRLLFDGQNKGEKGFNALACQIVGFVSFASMACYMFHRFFYWAAERIWNPSDATVKWLMMAGLVYPIIVILSYVIQKTYDHILNCISPS